MNSFIWFACAVFLASAACVTQPGPERSADTPKEKSLEQWQLSCESANSRSCSVAAYKLDPTGAKSIAGVLFIASDDSVPLMMVSVPSRFSQSMMDIRADNKLIVSSRADICSEYGCKKIIPFNTEMLQLLGRSENLNFTVTEKDGLQVLFSLPLGVPWLTEMDRLYKATLNRLPSNSAKPVGNREPKSRALPKGREIQI